MMKYILVIAIMLSLSTISFSQDNNKKKSNKERVVLTSDDFYVIGTSKDSLSGAEYNLGVNSNPFKVKVVRALDRMVIKKRVLYGVGVGYNSSVTYLHNDNGQEGKQNSIGNIYFSAHLRYIFNPRLSLQLEAMYSQFGMKYVPYLSEKSEKISISSEALCIPLIFRLKLIPALSLDLGTQYVSLSKPVLEDTSNSLYTNVSTEQPTIINDYDISLCTGVTVDLYKGLSIVGRFYYGFNQLYKVTLSNGDLGEARVNNLSIGLSYSF